MNSHEIRKAVIPAAGLGTRLLPFTKTVPKEMLPIAGKPLIQLAVEEAAASGIETVILVISGTKDLIAKHFQRDSDLERDLERKGNTSEVAAIRELSTIADIRTVLQSQPRGLADAIAVAQSAVG